MKYTKKAKKYTKKRRSTKVNTVNRTMVRAGLGFPLKMAMTHKYFETIDMASTSGSTVTYSFHANSLFDPNYSGSGHQPLYYDNMAAIYNHYCVIGSKITVKLAGASTSNTSTSFALYLNDDVTATPTLSSLMEQSKSKYCVIPAGSNNIYSCTLKWSAKKTFGGSILGNPSLSAATNANPLETSVFTIAGFPQNLTSTQTYNMQVMIEYIAVWTELKDVAGS